MAAALVSVVLGSLVLLSWALDLASIENFLPGLTTMRPSAAAGFVLGGCSLLMLRRGPEAYAWTRGFAVGLLGLMVVAWIGLLLAEIGVATIEPLRMGFHVVLGFTLQAIALLLLTKERTTARNFGGEAALGAAFMGWAGLIVYTYSVGSRHGSPSPAWS